MYFLLLNFSAMNGYSPVNFQFIKCFSTIVELGARICCEKSKLIRSKPFYFCHVNHILYVTCKFKPSLYFIPVWKTEYHFTVNNTLSITMIVTFKRRKRIQGKGRSKRQYIICGSVPTEYSRITIRTMQMRIYNCHDDDANNC